jgi:hypothetical protein
MPFTVSHAAAVLPFSRLLKRWHVLSAAIIGSMVPDFGIFLPWELGRFETHGLRALFIFCLPVGLTAYWLFQYLIKVPLLELLPDSVYWRWKDYAQPASIRNIRQWCLAALGVLAGAVSHLIWDGFTHEGARGVQMFPSLDNRAVDIAGHSLYGYAVLQYASSVVGLCIVLFCLYRGLRPDPAQVPPPSRKLTPRDRNVWCYGFIFLATMSIGMLFVISRTGPLTEPGLQALARDAAVAALRGLTIALIGISLILRTTLKD